MTWSVSLSITRSGYDFLDETEYPVVGYAIYRRLDNPLLVQQVKSQPAVPVDETLDNPQFASFDPGRVRRLADRKLRVTGVSSGSPRIFRTSERDLPRNRSSSHRPCSK